MMEEPRKAPKKIKPKPTEMEKIFNDPEIETLIQEATAYCNRALEVKDLDSLIYIKYQLGFSFDLVEYLLEYAAEIKKTNFSYIEKVAINWYEEGIEAREEAEEYNWKPIGLDPNIKKDQEQELFIDNEQNEKIEKLDIKFAPLFHKIEEVLDKVPDSLGRGEKNQVYTWIVDYKATPQEIIDACRKAKKHDKKNIEYVNNIIIKWKKQQLRFLEAKELNEFDFSVLS